MALLTRTFVRGNGLGRLFFPVSVCAVGQSNWGDFAGPVPDLIEDGRASGTTFTLGVVLALEPPAFDMTAS